MALCTLQDHWTEVTTSPSLSIANGCVVSGTFSCCYETHPDWQDLSVVMIEGAYGMDVRRILSRIEEAEEPSEVRHFLIRTMVHLCTIYCWLVDKLLMASVWILTSYFLHFCIHHFWCSGCLNICLVSGGSHKAVSCCGAWIPWDCQSSRWVACESQWRKGNAFLIIWDRFNS